MCSRSRSWKRASKRRWSSTVRLRKRMRVSRKSNNSLVDYTRNGYQWFQVAELNYDSFMVRHSR